MKVTNILSAPSIHNYEENRQMKGETRTNGEANQPVASNQEEKQYSKNDIKQAVESLNGFIEPMQTNLKFVFHEELNEYYVTVINPLTDEVIKEIPPKRMLDFYAAMAESMGILIDKKI